MALSGSSSKTFGSQNSFRLVVEWSASQNIGGNTSSVTAVLYLQSMLSWASFSDATASGTSITINGNTKTFNVTSSISGNQKRELGRHTVTVGHNGDGTKTFSISATHNIDITYSGTRLGSQTTSGSYTLNTIPRASSVTVNKSSADIGSVVRLSIKRASTSFTHTMTYDWGGNTGTIASKINYEQFDWTVPTSFLNIIKNASSGWGTITCQTYSGSTLIGTSSTKLTTTVPANIIPTTSSVSITDGNTALNALVGASVYVQGLSDITLAINGASGISGSTITGYTINFDGRSWGSQSAKVGTIAKSGVVSGSAYVTDSRGRRSASRSFSYSFLPYAPPTISSATVSRTGGVLGQDVLVKRVGRISGLGGKNKYTAYLDYKEKSSTTWTSLSTETVTGALGVESFDLTNTTTGSLFLSLKSYDFRINIHDSLTKSTAITSISTASTTLSFGKNGIGIGKIHEGTATLEIGGGIRLMNTIWSGSQGEGYGGLHLNNSDITGANGIYFNDVSSNNGEGLMFLKDGATEGSTNFADYDKLAMRAGKLALNDVTSGQVLWSGSAYMHGSHDFYPSKTLRECPNGWVLVWSFISTSGTAGNYDWNYTYVHKRHADRSGQGTVIVVSSDGNKDVVFNKYLSIYDNHILGYASNSTDTNGTITLREVLAW